MPSVKHAYRTSQRNQRVVSSSQWPTLAPSHLESFRPFGFRESAPVRETSSPHSAAYPSRSTPRNRLHGACRCSPARTCISSQFLFRFYQDPVECWRARRPSCGSTPQANPCTWPFPYMPSPASRGRLVAWCAWQGLPGTPASASSCSAGIFGIKAGYFAQALCNSCRAILSPSGPGGTAAMPYSFFQSAQRAPSSSGVAAASA